MFLLFPSKPSSNSSASLFSSTSEVTLNLSLYALSMPTTFLQHAFCLTSSSSPLSSPFHSSPPVIYCLHSSWRDPSENYIRPYHSPTNNPNSQTALNLKARPWSNRQTHCFPLYPNLEFMLQVSLLSFSHFLCLHSSSSRSFHGFASSCQSCQLKSCYS